MPSGSKWTESIALGLLAFVEQIEGQIKGRQEREIQSNGDVWILKKARASKSDESGDLEIMDRERA
jgi:hypothetical protein